METTASVNARAKSGIKLMLGRQIFLLILTFGGGVILARILNPTEFGLFVIASFIVSLFAQFGDFGLAPAFIQRKKELADRDLQVAFTLQQIMTSAIVLIILGSAPYVLRFYPKAPPETVWLVRVLALNLFLMSWRSMSALQMERQLRYGRLAWIEIAENLFYQVLMVVLAVLHFGTWSFIWATLGRGVLGTLLAYLAAPWRIRFAFDREIATQMLRFGIPFQCQYIINGIGGWMTPALIGSLIGAQAVGYVSWASSNGKKPLTFVQNLSRVAFPHFSRLQDDHAEAERVLIKYLNYIIVPQGLWFVAILVAGHDAVRVIYTSKWVPAVPALILSAAAMLFDGNSMIMGMALNGLGLVARTTRIILARTIIHVTLCIPLVLTIGYNGVPVAYLIASAITIPWLTNALRPGASKRIAQSMAWILIPMCVSIAVGLALGPLHVRTFMHLIASLASTTSAYIVATWLSCPQDWRDTAGRAIRRFIRPRPEVDPLSTYAPGVSESKSEVGAVAAGD